VPIQAVGFHDDIYLYIFKGHAFQKCLADITNIFLGFLEKIKIKPQVPLTNGPPPMRIFPRRILLPFPLSQEPSGLRCRHGENDSRCRQQQNRIAFPAACLFGAGGLDVKALGYVDDL
jgi:hypothetical protein